ncbi:RING/U-box superfamily protein [Euphorbia peplus]|nr:RING/U-box superfamily protein [Euphorbia peplus]
MEISENQSISCRITQLENVEPDDDAFPWYMFSLDISITFTNYSERALFLIERSTVLDEITSTSNLRDILLEMNVPLSVLEDPNHHVFIIPPILESARTMASTESLISRKILRLRVEIDFRMSWENEHLLNSVMPASESSIEALEKVSIEEVNKQNCVICLEELMIGCEAIRLPCSHLYHHTCILFWLKCNGVCPLCRFRI